MGNDVCMRPCPFCGGSSLKVEAKTRTGWRTSYRYTASVRCNKCHARGSTAYCDSACDIEQAKGRAVTNWNFRQIGMDMQMEDSE